MATTAEWLEGARPRTLPTAIAPVLAGTAIAIADGGARWGLATLCLVVALGLVIGVNFANDYSDGIRGSDGEDRVGPLRLVGSGVAEPSHVKRWPVWSSPSVPDTGGFSSWAWRASLRPGSTPEDLTPTDMPGWGRSSSSSSSDWWPSAARCTSRPITLVPRGG